MMEDLHVRKAAFEWLSDYLVEHEDEVLLPAQVAFKQKVMGVLAVDEDEIDGIWQAVELPTTFLLKTVVAPAPCKIRVWLSYGDHMTHSR
jgi:hypothetical protein